MSKSKFLNYKLLTKSNIALVLTLALIAGFLASRAVLSLATIAFGINALWNVHPKKWFQNRWWLLGTIWVLAYIISYYWSSDIPFWYHHCELKMPVLLFPLAFAFLPSFSYRQLLIFTITTGIMLLAGACYSGSFLIGNLAYYMEQYRVAHVLPTPAEGDYIRFSVFIALFVMWCFSFWTNIQSKKIKWLIAGIVVLLVLYLHLLASKSGLLTFYIFITAWAIYISVSKKRVWAGLGLIITAILFLLLAVRFIPTLHQRVGYISYTYKVFTEGDESGHYGDIDRLMSYNVAGNIIKDHIARGVGAGDMLDEMIKGYDKLYPQVQEENRLLPHNQFLIVALGCGIPIAIFFVVWVFYPLSRVKKNKKSFYFFMVWFVLLIQLMIEPVLEVQNGVFVYLFFLLWQYHTIREDINAAGHSFI